MHARSAADRVSDWLDALEADFGAIAALAAGLAEVKAAGGWPAGLAGLAIDHVWDAVESWLEAHRSPDRRRALGAWYTPADLAARMAELGVDRSSVLRSVVDPACGTGRLLYAVVRRARALGLQPERVVGVDVDPLAIAAAKLLWALDPQAPAVTWVVGESLLEVDWSAPEPKEACFDLVIANPPYVDSETHAREAPVHRKACRAAYRTARGNWDLFCPFVELAARLAGDGGLVLLVPSKLASAPYGQEARRLLAARQGMHTVLDLSGDGDFEAGVYPLVYAWRPGPAETVRCGRGVGPWQDLPTAVMLPPDGAPWPVIGATTAGLALLARSATLPVLGDHAELWGGATVAEAYALADLLQDRPEPAEGDLRVLNSGTIDPHRALWGERSIRYLGRSLLHPVVPAEALHLLPARRLAQARQPKVIVASLTRRLEAVADPDGRWLAAKSTVVVLVATAEAAVWWSMVLNSAHATALYRARFGGHALQGGHLRVGPAELAGLPVPAIGVDRPIRQRAVERWKEGRLEELDALVAAAYSE